MQAQAQLAGQVPGCIPLADRPTAWQNEASDVPLRRRVLDRISQVFLRAKHQFSLEWQQRIPDLVKLVEDTLYKEAASRDDYQDAQTLDRRLQIVANRFLPSQQRASSMIDDLSRSSAPVSTLMGTGSNMVPTPGMGGSMMPTPGFSSGMIPTPGTNNVVPMRTGSTMMPTPGLASNKLGLRGNTGNMGNFVATSNQTFAAMQPPQNAYQGLNGARILQNAPLVSTGFSTGGMQMVPTPGLSMQQHPGMSSGPVNQVHAQQFTPGNMVGNNITLKGNGMTNGMVMTRQQLLNGNVGSAAYASMLQQQQQGFNQQRMQLSTSMASGANGGSYAMNAADLAGSGNMYASNGMSINPQVPKMSTPSEVPSQPQVVQQQSHQHQPQPQPQTQPHQQQQQQQQSQPSLQQQHQQRFQTSSSQMQQVQLQRGTFQQNGQHSMMVRQDSETFQPSDLLREVKQSAECQSSSVKMEQQSAQRQLSPKNQDQQVRHQMQLPKAEAQALVPESQETQPRNPSPVQNLQHQSPMQEPPDARPPAEQGVVKQEQESPMSSVCTQGVQGQAGNSISSTRAQQYLKQQRWLLFLRHASKCKEGPCPSNQHCRTARELLDHISKCRIRDRECPYPRCSASMKLLMHHQVCRDARCPVCGPVRQTILKTVAPGAARENGPPAKRPKLDDDSEQTEGFAYSNGKAEAQDVKPQGVYANGQDTKPQIKVDAQVQLKQNIKAEHGSTELADTKSGALVPGPPGVATQQVAIGKGGKPKLLGVSLTELFTPEQIRQHISSLRQWVGQSKSKAEKNQAMEHQPNDNACPLCAVEKLSFEPPPIYCTSCGIKVKRNMMYYTTAVRETRHYFCVPCYNDVKTEMVELEGLTYPKANLEKRKHDEETEEAWVCCDKCNLWQHQICALFNARRNEGAETEYTCPQCCMAEMESGERVTTPASAVLGAKDLPRTVLSDRLEQRLAGKLRQERTERARAQGKSLDEVPGAEGLVVRVVSSVDKKLEVKPRFLEIFQEEDYPTEFPYKSKAVLLFQQIEGVEVCLYGMYVQEFGVESAQPNQRRVYLSYLDSVKYFRPDVRTLNGEALRTFVYHELLIGYLEYCKVRGFSSCYIWACPPLKGEDYILYCHPEIQKTPKSDKLREWYLTMLLKATKENIVAEVTNFYDHFFVSAGECKAKVTAARLPYFDGDYWPGAAEDMILQLQQQADDDDSKQQKKGKVKKPPTKRATKAAAQMEMALNASKDVQLMLKLGESIMPMKEDFIMVHMHHSCTHCRLFITSGNRWICKSCKKFQLCDRCNDAEMKLDDRERHPPNSKEVHQLIPIEVNDVPPDTRDPDEIMESEFFDTRHAFLSLCQGNHYQYDTLRRAKHSSMMVLYHLHNPMAPAFVITCCICNNDIEAGQGWRCETCTEYDVCDGCYQKEETKRHPHRLVPHPSTDRSQNKEARQQRVQQLRTMLDLLLHASHCTTATCKYPNCCSLKRLFRHGMTCQKRIAGGCMFCKKMWYFMQLHARACKQTQCRVPRCKDLKEHLRRLQHQMESRRRAAVNEMMRQRAAETAGRT